MDSVNLQDDYSFSEYIPETDYDDYPPNYNWIEKDNPSTIDEQEFLDDLNWQIEEILAS